LVALELALDGLVRTRIVRVVLIARDSGGELGGGAEPPRRQQTDNQIDQSFGAGAGHPQDGSPLRTYGRCDRREDQPTLRAHGPAPPLPGGHPGRPTIVTAVSGVRWRSGRVVARGRTWRGAVELTVALDRRDPDDPDQVPALAYPVLVGEPVIGDRVLVNTGALALGLGIGGYALVVAVPDRLPPDQPGGHDRAAGHLVKARYTPLQLIVAGVDEQESPHHRRLAEADD